MSAAASSVSVVMRSKNSAWVIDQALAALCAQDLQPSELLVVDSGSTDRTLDIVGKFPARVLRIPAADYYPGKVLNHAIEQASGDLLVFQNSDAVPTGPHALRRLVRAFDDPAVQAAFARQVPRPDAHAWVRRDYAASFPPREPAPPWMAFSLPFAALRRSIWQQHPFYTDAWGSEDTEWGWWARRHGALVRYVADAVVMHSHNYTLRQLFGRRFIEGEADAFIHRNRVGLFATLGRVLRSAAADIACLAGERCWSELALTWPRRAVFHWAYYRGHCWGRRRIAARNADASVGQRIVLDRYGR